MRVHLDFETRSTCDIRDSGAWIYSKHPETKILCMAYALDEGPVTLLDRYFFEDLNAKPPEDLIEAINAGCEFAAHNASFEQYIWLNILVSKYRWPELPVHRWLCTAAKASVFGLPRSLGEVSKALGLPLTKDSEGRNIMLRLL